jgi:hypothetical protein
MADNRPAELMAEQYVGSELLKYDIKTTKPYFDENGTDLLIVDQVSHIETAILRVQSKGRRYAQGKPSSVTIPQNYVSANFLLALYVINEHYQNTLFVFFEEDLKTWKINTGGEYYLTISENSLARLQSNLMSVEMAVQIRQRLKLVDIKKYTTVLIDGIFLEKAIQTTMSTYQEIWPERKLQKPALSEIIHQILYNYNRYPNTVAAIQCQVFLSKDFHLEQWATLPDETYTDIEQDHVKLTLSRTDKIVSFEILDHLERIVNNENILLVADDIIYEPPLNKLKEDGTDVILVKLQTDLGGNLYTPHRWGDITRPLALAMGLEPHEL